MKRKLLLLLGCLYLLSTLPAQVTVTNVSFPAIGDTLISTIDAMPTIDLLSPNVENTWDFTSLAGITQETIILAASAGEFSGEFPGADQLIGSVESNGEFYFKVTNNTYEAMGYVGPDPADFGINILAKLLPTSVERRSPMNFFDVNTDESNIQVTLSADLIPGGILDTFFLFPDSIRFRISTERLDKVDAWGTLHIPGGSYEVLREYRLQEQETRLDVLVGLGSLAEWYDVTDALGLDFLGIDTTITYNFFSNDAKEPIAVVTVDNVTDDPISVRYKSNNAATSSRYLDKGRADMFAYPNPAVNDVRFDFINLPTDTYDLKIYNILGVEVLRNRYHINNSRTVKLDLSFMRKGTYLYSLLDSKGKPVTTKRLVIIKP